MVFLVISDPENGYVVSSGTNTACSNSAVGILWGRLPLTARVAKGPNRGNREISVAASVCVRVKTDLCDIEARLGLITIAAVRFACLPVGIVHLLMNAFFRVSDSI